ncbi:uncharacterized protein LOC119663416, partial [Teleopsis dalmanni]|uniref:uncharacterized protein LOC119663416 n=1 Tax=Teleopsis dalmanni TaxID=139649 RepID=UPI0018CD35D4
MHLRLVLDRLRETGLTVNFAKCKFGCSEIEFLGHVISAKGLRPPESKVQAVRDFPLPATVKQLRQFLGMVNFYRPFLRNAVQNQQRLFHLTPGNRKNDKSVISWTPEDVEVFEACKNDLAQATLLNFMALDAQLTLTTDASDVAVGAVLQQVVKGVTQPLAFYSKGLSPAQTKYSAYDPNGMVERFHRTLKAAIRCHSSSNWTQSLPLVLLGLRTTPKLDLNASPSEMLFGNPLCVPGQMLSDFKQKSSETDFVSALRRALAKVKSVESTRHCHPSVYVPRDVINCKHVFLRVDRARAPLEQPYEGPFEVLSRNEKTSVIVCRGREVTVSNDRLKAAYLTCDDLEQVVPETRQPSALLNGDQLVTSGDCRRESLLPIPKVTRAGRVVRFPA